MITRTTHLAHILATDAGVDPEYRHVPRHVTPGEPLQAPGVLLKWYAVHPAARPVPDDMARLARDHLASAALDAKGLGFVVLHRCGSDFYFLIVCTWRNNNELWQTVFYKNGDEMADFALFPRDGDHKPILCVWELVPVQHEQRAWTRFLTSTRDEAAAWGGGWKTATRVWPERVSDRHDAIFRDDVSEHGRQYTPTLPRANSRSRPES